MEFLFLPRVESAWTSGFQSCAAKLIIFDRLRKISDFLHPMACTECVTGVQQAQRASKDLGF